LSRVRGGTRDEMTGSSLEYWTLLALCLQPLSITLNHSAIAIPHTLQSTLHTNPRGLFPAVFTTTLHLQLLTPRTLH
jgi:hypothetical protein